MQASQHPRNKSAPPSQPELSEHRSFSEDACSFLRRNHLSARLFSVIVHEHVHFRAVLIIYYNTYCILDISVFDNSRMPSTLKFLKIILFCAFPYFSVTQWQATSCPDSTSVSTGRIVLHFSMQCSQRFWNGQPWGTSRGLGASLSMLSIFLF